MTASPAKTRPLGQPHPAPRGVMDGDAAFAARRAVGPARRFPQDDDARIRDGLLFPRLFPKFTVAPGQRAFTIGSCFAREIEERLAGFDVPTRSLRLPSSEVDGRGNSVLNEFNPGSMAQRIRWAVEGADTSLLPGHHGDEAEVEDLLFVKGHAVPLSRLKEIRRAVDGIYALLPGSDFLVVTLGMVEVWRDEARGLYLNRLPGWPAIRAEPNRFRFHRLTVEEVVDLMGEAIQSLVGLGLRRVLLTVSPVPLRASFAPQDCVVANSYSKGVLRVAADRLSSDFGEVVDYFPSYEIVQSGGLGAFREDHIHVRPEVVDRIMAYMTEHYVA